MIPGGVRYGKALSKQQPQLGPGEESWAPGSRAGPWGGWLGPRHCRQPGHTYQRGPAGQLAPPGPPWPRGRWLHFAPLKGHARQACGPRPARLLSRHPRTHLPTP